MLSRICPWLPRGRGPKMRRDCIFCGPFVTTEVPVLA